MAPSKYDFTPTEREKRLGMLKFGADWQFGDNWTSARVDRFLNLLELRFRPPVEYLADGECPKAWPVEALEYGGPEEQREDNLREYRCGVLGKQQLAEVRELLRLYDRYGPTPKGPEDFERLDAGDDREKLREARRLMIGSQADGKPSVPMILAPEAVTYATAPKSVSLKRPKRARNKALPPKRLSVVKALKQRGIDSRAAIETIGFANLAAEMAPKIKCYGASEHQVHALETMLKRLKNGDFAAVK